MMTLRPERKALVKGVFNYPAMGFFNWRGTPSDYALPACGKPGPIHLEGRHSVILKYEGVDSFDQRCQELQSR